MRNVINYIIYTSVLVLSLQAFGQASSEKLRIEQSRLEKKIATTKLLLNKTQDVAKASFNELLLIDKQIKFRQDLVTNFDNQVRSAEVKVKQKGNEITQLQAKLIQLKEQYRKLLLYAYKHRNKFGKLMFIFSSESYNEAIKRGSYLKRIAEIQKKQFLIIRQHENLIQQEISSIQQERAYKLKVLLEKKKEKEAIEVDKQKQEKVYKKFKQEELELVAQLRQDENKKEVLRQKINAAIQKEIAAAETKRKKEEEERNKVKASTPKSTSTTTTTTGTKPKAESATVVFTESKESVALSKNFEGNKGKLPWPVDRGTVTEGFGKNAHPTLTNVYTNNNGIDISAPKNAQVRAVFEGEVTSVFSIAGAGKVVIIKHGNYRTVYSNLQDVYVNIGATISTKQTIGSLIAKDGNNVSVAHFEIHVVNGSNVQCLNPSLWVSH
jgi:septal ring factor EnvC (AmiA/AmiB activator)